MAVLLLYQVKVVLIFFFEKLSPTEVVLWAGQYGGSGLDNGISIVAVSENNIYLTGIFTGTLNFGK